MSKGAEVESLRTHFEFLGLGLEGQVLGLDLEAYMSSKMPCPWPRTALIFESLKMGHGHDLFFTLPWKTPETSRKICKHLFFGGHLEHFFEDLFYFLENTCALCPCPRKGLSSKSLSLSLASEIFDSLAVTSFQFAFLYLVGFELRLSCI